MMHGVRDELAPLLVEIGTLVPYANNARQGDVGVIAESLALHGQYRPVVARTGTGEVLAGNHTLAAAHELGWTHLAATHLDVDDEQARRIVLVDNRTQELGDYDDDALAAMLTRLAGSTVGLEGSGFTPDDFASLLTAMEKAADPEPADEPEGQGGWPRLYFDVPESLFYAWADRVGDAEPASVLAGLLEVDISGDAA